MRALLVIAVLIVSVVAIRSASARPRPGASVKSMSTEKLGAELRALRQVRGHFSSPQGEWNADVDGAGGRKEQVLGELGARLARATRARIVRVMGRPDAVARPGDMLWTFAASSDGALAKASEDTELLVYYWRGSHDFLYFVADGRQIRRSGWWMAFE